jgi:hypothetical protein
MKLLLPTIISLLLVYSLRSSPSAVDLSKVDFAKECVSVSDPSDRLLYGHEETVNSFLEVFRKFGKGRMLVVHRSNAHLATHGGTIDSPGEDEWNEKGIRYTVANEWGLLGNVNLPRAKAYSIKVSPFLKEKNGNGVDPGQDVSDSMRAKPNLEERAADSFEAYALQRLKKGDVLVRWERPDFLRAVGAVRAETVCLKCHEVKKGDLLGAFTYQFSKMSADEAAKKDKRQIEQGAHLWPRETLEVLEGNRKGLSIEAIARTLPRYRNLNNPKDRWGAYRDVESQLLHAGIVTEEMLSSQRKERADLLESTVALLEEVETAK